MLCLLTGARGLLAHDVLEVWSERGHSVVGLGHEDLDITSAEQVRRALDQSYDVIVNCAAWTDVDEAEAHEADAFAVNALGAGILARAAAERGTRLVHLSTDYVFDGRADHPYTTDAPLRPTGAYGRTKAAGELAVRAEAPEDHLIVRTAWLYGTGGPCFPRTVQRLLGERGAVSVVDDQRGQPTWARDVADLIERLVAAQAPAGTYHATSSGETTWFDFAREILADMGPEAVRPTTSATFPRPAARPAYSVLSHRSLHDAGITPIGHWRQRWRAAQHEFVRHDRAVPRRQDRVRGAAHRGDP
jgi:dTDP-4-dehydrorhamnose reductase